MGTLLAGACAQSIEDEMRVAAMRPGPPQPTMEEIFAPDPRPASERYVPIDIWQDAGTAGFHERWYGGQLAAMQEPILSRPGDRQDFRRRFRMLFLPSFHHAYAIRIDEAASGEGHVRIVRLDGAGGYAPGRILEQESLTLGGDAMAELTGAIERAGLGTLPPTANADCLDGAGFVFELIDDSGYHFVDRHQCNLTTETEMLIGQVDSLRRRVGSDMEIYRLRDTGSLRPPA